MNRIKKIFFELSLTRKITIMIAIILAIPTCWIGNTYYQEYVSSLYVNADKKLEEKMGDIDRALEKSLENVENAFNDIEYSQELLYFLDKGNMVSDRETEVFWENMQEEWINLRQIYPGFFTQMNIYASNSKIQMENNWKLKTFQLEDFPVLEKVKKNKNLWFGQTYELGIEESETGKSNVDYKDLVLPAYWNVRNVGTDELIGIIELDIPFEKLINAEELAIEKSDIQYVFSDSYGKVIYPSGDEQSKKIMKKIPEGKIKTINAGEEYRVLKNKNRAVNLICTVAVNEQIIKKPAKEMIWVVGMTAGVGIALIICLTYLVIKWMLKRLVELDRAMQQIETGDFQITMDEDRYMDEVSRLKKRFMQMTQRLKLATQEIVERKTAQNEAELKALQAQINPHFLFNTLETMRMQCEIDRYYKVGNALTALGELFRYTIRGREYKVPFYQEWNHLQNYVALMALRLDEDFSYEMNCEEKLKYVTVPKMFLQPLVENSFQHGFKMVPAPWRLKVEAYKENEMMIIRITDNGGGIDEEQLKRLQREIRQRHSIQGENEKRQSIGIINVIQRMDKICPGNSDIFIENGKAGGIDIRIKIMMDGKVEEE